MCPLFEVVLVALSGGLWGYLGEVLRGDRGFLDSFLVSEQFADGSYLRGCQVLFRWGGGFLLGWSPLEATSVTRVHFCCHLLCWRFFECLGCSEGAWHVVMSLFILICLLFAPLHIMSLSYILGAGFRWAGYFCFEIRSWCLAAILFWLDMVFLWRNGGKGCPADLILKFGGPITFDSRSGVSSLVKLVFGLWFCALLVDRMSWDCGSYRILLLWAFRMWLSLGVEVWEFYFEGCYLVASSDDGRWWIPCLHCLFSWRGLF